MYQSCLGLLSLCFMFSLFCDPLADLLSIVLAQAAGFVDVLTMGPDAARGNIGMFYGQLGCQSPGPAFLYRCKSRAQARFKGRTMTVDRLAYAFQRLSTWNIPARPWNFRFAERVKSSYYVATQVPTSNGNSIL